MCLIIKKPPGRQIAADFLANAWRHNHHGWGWFYRDARQGQLVWDRGLDFEELLERHARLPLETEVYLHLRRATYGEVHHDMAHPFVVRPGLLLMHNGSIAHLAPQDTCRSDTAELARMLHDMLSGLSDEQAAVLIRSQGLQALIAPLIDGSMLVLMDARGAVRLGRDWHRVQPAEWHEAMVGVEVSNAHTWAPHAAGCDAAARAQAVIQAEDTLAAEALA